MNRWHRRAVVTGIGVLTPLALLATVEVSCVGSGAPLILPGVDSSLPGEDSAPPPGPEAGVDSSHPPDATPDVTTDVQTTLDAPADVQSHDAPNDTSVADASDSSLPETGPLDAGPPPDAADDAGSPPNDVQPSHLQLWLRADFGVFHSGATEPYPVSGWADLSGHGHDATQPNAASQPLLHTTTPLTGTTSALPWLEFTPGTGDGTGDDAGTNGLEFNVDLSFLANAGYTIFAVASRHTDKTENYFLGTHFGGPSSNNEALHVGWSDNTDYYLGQFGNDLSATVTANTSTGWQPALGVGKLDVDAGHFIYLGGVMVANNADTNPLTLADLGVLGRGYGSTPDNTYFSGGIGELIVYDTALADVDRQAIEGYLKSRWQTP